MIVDSTSYFDPDLARQVLEQQLVLLAKEGRFASFNSFLSSASPDLLKDFAPDIVQEIMKEISFQSGNADEDVRTAHNFMCERFTRTSDFTQFEDEEDYFL